MCIELVAAYLKQRPIFDTPWEEKKTPPLIEEDKPIELKNIEILLLWKNEEEGRFLEKVASALSRSVGKARCAKWHDSYFTERTLSLILAPANLIDVEPHHLLKDQRPALLGLFPIEQYQQNIQLKRALWNQLQNLNDSLA